MASWLIAAKTTHNLRDRRLIALSGILPDLDGAGILVDIAQQSIDGGASFWFYQKYHHSLLHGIVGALVISVVLALFGRERGRVAVVAFIVVHLHLLCDFVGSRGPGPQDIWPIPYLAPFSHSWTWYWRGQWPLDAWPNRFISLILFAGCISLALRLGDSVVGVFNRRADRVFVAVIRRWSDRCRKPRLAPARSHIE